MSGFRSSHAKVRAHAEADLPRRRSRWVSGFPLYQSMVVAIGLVSSVVAAARLVELALRAAHRRRLVAAVERGLLGLEPLGRLLVRVLLRGRGVGAGGGAGRDALLRHLGRLRPHLAQLVLVEDRKSTR